MFIFFHSLKKRATLYYVVAVDYLTKTRQITVWFMLHFGHSVINPVTCQNSASMTSQIDLHALGIYC